MTARRPYQPRCFLGCRTQREAAILFMLKRTDLWLGKRVSRYAPGRFTSAWGTLADALKGAGIYSYGTYTWDLRLDSLVKEVTAIHAEMNEKSHQLVVVK